MPYISPEAIMDLQLATGLSFSSSGDLNYMLTQVAVQYVEDRGLSYNTINDVLGALEGAKQEFYRRVAVPYEDKKRKANGDVYPEWLTGRKDTRGKR